MDDWNKFPGNMESPSQPRQEAPQPRQEAQRTEAAAESGPSGTDPRDEAYAGFAAAERPRKKKEKFVTKKVFVLTIVIAMLFSAALGAGVSVLVPRIFGGQATNKTVFTTNYDLAKATGSELSIQEIILKNENSVVAITTESVSTDSWIGQYVTNGAGSGVVYSKDGYILTNNHVIDGATSVKVTLHDGTSYDASVVASDAQSDVAVIKIDADNLTPVTLGSSEDLAVGDLAVAIGNPLGKLAGTATDGIISGLGREITIEGRTMTLLQVSASINPGNSGGGVFDQYGNLIGLVVAKSSGSNVEGLGFAIPVDTVKTVADSLIDNGYVKGRPAAGIKLLDLTSASDAMKYGVRVTGVYISEVDSEKAKAAGLQAGDLVYMIDGQQVTSSNMLKSYIQSQKVGDKVTFTVVRDDKMMDIEVELVESSTVE